MRKSYLVKSDQRICPLQDARLSHTARCPMTRCKESRCTGAAEENAPGPIGQEDRGRTNRLRGGKTSNDDYRSGPRSCHTTSPILGPSTPRRPPSATTTVRWCGFPGPRGLNPRTSPATPPGDSGCCRRRDRQPATGLGPVCPRGCRGGSSTQAEYAINPVPAVLVATAQPLSVHRSLVCSDCPTRPRWSAVGRCRGGDDGNHEHRHSGIGLHTRRLGALRHRR